MRARGVRGESNAVAGGEEAAATAPDCDSCATTMELDSSMVVALSSDVSATEETLEMSGREVDDRDGMRTVPLASSGLSECWSPMSARSWEPAAIGRGGALMWCTCPLPISRQHTRDVCEARVASAEEGGRERGWERWQRLICCGWPTLRMLSRRDTGGQVHDAVSQPRDA